MEKIKLENMLDRRIEKVSKAINYQVVDLIVTEDTPYFLPQSEKTKEAISNYNAIKEEIKESFGEEILDFKKYEKRLQNELNKLCTDD